MSEFKVKRLDAGEIMLAKELILMFGFDDETRLPPADEYVGEMLARPDFHVIVALDGEQLIGGLTAYQMKMFKRETTEMFLYEIEVAESYRRRGVGKSLIEFLKAVCRENGIVEIFVGTEKDNVAARRLYAATGGAADEGSVWFSYKFG